MADLDRLTVEQCTVEWGASFLAERMLCVDDDASTLCFGDSGGPLVVEDGHGGWRTIGITTCGSNPCADAPTVAMRAVDFVEWMESVVGSSLTGTPPPQVAHRGYWFAGEDGGVFSFGETKFFGSLGGFGSMGVVDLATTATGDGYWLAMAGGSVASFGDAFAIFLGFFGAVEPPPPLSAVAATPTGEGLWMMFENGSISALGDAVHHGDFRLGLAPMIDLAASPTGKGYWQLSSDGGVFAFGDGGFYGSGCRSRPRQPGRCNCSNADR